MQINPPPRIKSTDSNQTLVSRFRYEAAPISDNEHSAPRALSILTLLHIERLKFVLAFA